MPDYRLTIAAREDLRDIGRYTQNTWGKEQRRSYLARLEQAFEALASGDVKGRSRNDIRPGLSGYLCGRHIVFYRSINTDIEILRILHGRQSADKAFEERPFER